MTINPEEIALRIAKERGIKVDQPKDTKPKDDGIVLGGTAAGLELNEPPDGVVLPDFTEVMIGWRAWGIVKRGPVHAQGVRLQSVTQKKHLWLPREAMHGTCSGSPKCQKSTPNKVIESPGENCGCGLYSAKHLKHLQSMSYHRYDAERSGMYHVIGPVALWGKIVEGDQGWRAQKGYPQELYLPYEAWYLHDALEEAYGVPVKLKNFLKEEPDGHR